MIPTGRQVQSMMKNGGDDVGVINEHWAASSVSAMGVSAMAGAAKVRLTRSRAAIRVGFMVVQLPGVPRAVRNQRMPAITEFAGNETIRRPALTGPRTAEGFRTRRNFVRV